MLFKIQNGKLVPQEERAIDSFEEHVSPLTPNDINDPPNKDHAVFIDIKGVKTKADFSIGCGRMRSYYVKNRLTGNYDIYHKEVHSS